MIGCRLPVVDGQTTWPTEPGDYCGPVRGYTGDKQSIFFLKPHARDPGTPPHGRGVQHVACPPHTYVEESDGSLSIFPSIGDTRGDGSEGSDGWHGFLERGVWRQV
ncbi:hypothetical protein Gocc_2904 [Gaiella occulta]|uniref:Uncharacterized protein n=1 Tax=Gaiella occulta TaxID=1002870 RepID=A0A7M2YTT4_9ACTN|nr:hypothetical protein [Gaiella occulta]RDI73304.1 hypothetical protein Gocc_2904 [Gaiella occulta]